MFILLHRLQQLRRATATGPRRRGSLTLRHVDAGSCNGCEHELTAATNPFYDLQQHGLSIVASPRHADVLLVTGAITTRMAPALRTAYDAMPEPRLVAALGDCARAATSSAKPTTSPARSTPCYPSTCASQDAPQAQPRSQPSSSTRSMPTSDPAAITPVGLHAITPRDRRVPQPQLLTSSSAVR